TYYVPKALYNVLIIPTQSGAVLTDVLYDCYSVKNVQFAGNVKTISSYAFRLEHYTPSSMPFNVTLPSTLTTIESNAFLSRNDLTAIEFPSLLEEIGDHAFYGISSLRSVMIDSRGALGYVGRDAFSATPWYSTYTGVIALGKVVIGISEEYCRKATYYEIPADKFRSCSVIAPYAFAGNTVLQKITLSDTVSQVGENAFAGCTALKTFIFKQYVSTSARKLGATVLDGCSALFDLTICEDIDLDLLFASGVPASLRTLRIDNSSRSNTIVAVNESGFSASSLAATSVSSLYIGDGFVEIGEEAFRNATSLTYLSVAESVKTVAASAFNGCDSLTEAVGFAGLVTVAENAFDGCSALTSFAFPSGLNEIGDFAFRNCSFASFAAPASLTVIGESAFDGCSLLKEATLSASVISVGDRAFRGCDLSSLEIPSSVVFLKEENDFVGEEMLAGNNYFKSLTLSSGVTAARLFDSVVPTTFVRVAVKNCALTDDQFNGLTTIMTATLQNVTAIGDRAFYGCNQLQTIVIPATVTSIGESAFEGCSSLNSCQIDTAGTVLTEVKKKAFKNCSSLKFVVFPETIATGDWTELFYGCAALVTTNVPSAIKEIGESAYYGCEKLVSLRMHNNVETIGAFA
ncbi:MAG: leucine-rich repeat domain-containing protein, partial [Clostridia bacterium]|nr:leucine-rich repeat domain-containing protein [Clostridia bacterium]